MKKFDVVSVNGKLAVLLSDVLKVPYFEDGIASELSKVPLDLNNPEEWNQCFDAQVVYNLEDQKHELAESSKIEEFEIDKLNGYIPLDIGSSKLRVILGLMKFAEKCYAN